MRIIIIFIILAFSASCVFASMRIVSLSPGVTEILYELGLEDNIVGISSYCDYPDRVKDKKIVGDFSNPVLEKIVSLKPDIVFTAGIEQQDIAEKLRIYGINTETIEPYSINQLYKAIQRIGDITKRYEISLNLIDRMETEINSISLKVKNISEGKKPTVFILLWHSPLFTADKNSFLGDLLKTIGAENIVENLLFPYSRYSLEKLIQAKPDYILVCAMRDIDNNYIRKISNMSNSKVIDDLNPDLILRPGPRITEGIKLLYERLYYNEE